MIRVTLPLHLRRLARVEGEVALDVRAPVTLESILDELEVQYPALRGAVRDHATHERRALVRFYACKPDFSNEPPDTAVPDPVVTGQEPFMIVGSIAGGSDSRPL